MHQWDLTGAPWSSVDREAQNTSQRRNSELRTEMPGSHQISLSECPYLRQKRSGNTEMPLLALKARGKTARV